MLDAAVMRGDWSCSTKLVGTPPASSRFQKNLTLMSLPPACPELNAAENSWQYLRQTYLANRVFKSYTDILDASQDAWRRLLNETGRIASIATRDWAIVGQSQ